MCVVSARTITTFIIERPRRNGMMSDFTEMPPIAGKISPRAAPHKTATPIVTAITP